MASVTPMTLLITVAVLGFITPYLSGFSQEYGTSSATNTLVGLSYNISSTYNTRILEPLVGNPNGGLVNMTSPLLSGLNNTNTGNMAGASSLYGFAFAFILPGMINILLNLMYIPSIIGQAVNVLISFLPISGLQSTVLAAQITGLGWLFLGLLFFSSYLKYPIV